MHVRSLFSTACFAVITASARAQLIVGNDQPGTATIWSIDVGTGVATGIYSSTGTDSKPWGMAYDASTNTLYWNNSATLFSSPLANPLAPVSLGSMMFGAGTANFVSLSFWNGKLYGTRNITTEGVYEIDPVTLICAQTYVYPSTFDFGALEHDATTGLLYGLNDAAGAPGGAGLFRIDEVAMTTTFVAPYPAGEVDIDGLAVSNGIAYYVTDGPNTIQSSFYVFDISSGLQLGTIPSPFTGSGTFAAATWAGDPGAPPGAFCFGEGSGTTCPCGNNGVPWNGCASSVNANGGNLGTIGIASIASDTFVLLGSGMPNSSALYFQGTMRLNGGAGVVFGDGLRCVGGTIIRLGTKSNVGGSSQYPAGGDTPISIRGLNAPGNVRTYQTWYRNAAAFCTVSTFNLTNGVETTWVP